MGGPAGLRSGWFVLDAYKYVFNEFLSPCSQLCATPAVLACGRPSAVFSPRIRTAATGLCKAFSFGINGQHATGTFSRHHGTRAVPRYGNAGSPYVDGSGVSVCCTHCTGSEIS